MLGDTATGWKSSTQKCVTMATCEGGVIHKSCFGFPLARADIFGDNEGSKAIADNPISASRSKHIDVELHFIQD